MKGGTVKIRWIGEITISSHLFTLFTSAFFLFATGNVKIELDNALYYISNFYLGVTGSYLVEQQVFQCFLFSSILSHSAITPAYPRAFKMAVDLDQFNQHKMRSIYADIDTNNYSVQGIEVLSILCGQCFENNKFGRPGFVGRHPSCGN